MVTRLQLVILKHDTRFYAFVQKESKSQALVRYIPSSDTDHATTKQMNSLIYPFFNSKADVNQRIWLCGPSFRLEIDPRWYWLPKVAGYLAERRSYADDIEGCCKNRSNQVGIARSFVTGLLQVESELRALHEK